ncbi:MAG: DNA-deoxyinosine glycosylase [Pseudomonadota bacterium]
MSLVTSFKPLSLPCATVLVLGSMPGAASLQAQQYYAHPRNHFWPILARIAGFDVSAPYAQRVDALTRSGIAVWDVLQSCVRPGSLDSSIQAGTRIPNDFAAFFTAHPGIRLVCFNGAEAEKSYLRHVLPGLNASYVRYACLPSTSPAHAALGFEQKLVVWRAALGPQLGALCAVD